MVAFGVLDFEAAKGAIDLDTLLFLLGMMIVLGYLELSGFFEVIERRVLGWARSARALLWLVVVSAGLLSALFMNDTVCLMLAPIVIRVTRRLELPPVPYLIALATAANIGSSCTIIGNPQNALIAIRGEIGFLPFLGGLAPVTVVGLVVDGWFLTAIYRRTITGDPLVVPPPRERRPPQRYLMAASLMAGAGLVGALLLGAHPAKAAMTAGAAVILAGAARPRDALRQVDWSLLLFFGGLFVVMRAVDQAGLAHAIGEGITGPLAGSASPAALLARIGAAVTLLSQAVSNVPAVLLFVPPLQALPAAAAHPLWLALAAFSTLAGNLTIIGSVANVIVFEIARREGIEVGFLDYLKVGAPLTAVTLLAAWAWLALA
jgi:Na+/H+ antiporter NhaD/arsenite permease-like protein